MRYGIFGLALVIVLGTSCFDVSPTTETSATETGTTGEGTTGACQDGLEGCPCLEGECIGELVCLSMLCVAQGDETSSTTATEDTTGSDPATTTGEASTDTGTTDTGTIDTGSIDTSPVEPCDPLLQDCSRGEACNLVSNEFGCTPAGSVGFGEPCEAGSCAAGLLCVATPLLGCPGPGCCTSYCDLTDPGLCGAGLRCSPFVEEPVPGNEDVGICL